MKILFVRNESIKTTGVFTHFSNKDRTGNKKFGRKNNEKIKRDEIIAERKRQVKYRIAH